MRVGLVGLGSIGLRHLGNLVALGCDVVAMDVSHAAIARAKSQYPHVPIYDTLPMRHLDALVIATPYDNHLMWVEEAVRRKLPFFVEKPLGSLEQLPRWREIAAMDLPVNQVGYMLRFNAEAQRFKAWRDPIGGSFSLKCDMGAWPGHSYGPLLLEGSHEIDLALWCGAKPVVTSVSDGYIAMGLWSVTIYEGSYYRNWSITNTRGYHQWAFSSPEELGTEMYRDEMAHFVECVKEQKPTICPLSDGLKVLEVCQQVEAMTKAVA